MEGDPMTNPVQKVERPNMDGAGPFCKDGGTCHHACYAGQCLRQGDCAPLSLSGFDENWVAAKDREIADLKSKLAAAENRALDAEHLLNGHRRADANDAGNDEALRAIVAETGGRCGESVKGEAARLIAELRAKLVLVYEGRCVYRSRMDVVTVQLSHETWRTIQSLWYQSKRDAN